MTDPTIAAARRRLDAALSGLAATFRGMTAHPDEYDCECHWGSAEELALLKTPDVALEPDLLTRTWFGGTWTYPAEVFRRILPQFAAALVRGDVTPLGLETAGEKFGRTGWPAWPAAQATAIRDFLAAWWDRTLAEPEPVVPAHQVLPFLAEAGGSLRGWLDVWAATAGRAADRQLVDAADEWVVDLLGDDLPWQSWRADERERAAELADWLARHAPDRLPAAGAPELLVHRVRLLGLAGPQRWADPHFPSWRG